VAVGAVADQSTLLVRDDDEPLGCCRRRAPGGARRERLEQGQREHRPAAAEQEPAPVDAMDAHGASRLANASVPTMATSAAARSPSVSSSTASMSVIVHSSSAVSMRESAKRKRLRAKQARTSGCTAS